jgi:hypothetical protein
VRHVNIPYNEFARRLTLCTACAQTIDHIVFIQRVLNAQLEQEALHDMGYGTIENLDGTVTITRPTPPGQCGMNFRIKAEIFGTDIINFDCTTYP